MKEFIVFQSHSSKKIMLEAAKLKVSPESYVFYDEKGAVVAAFPIGHVRGAWLKSVMKSGPGAL